MGTVIGMVATTTGGVQSALTSIDVPSNGALIGVEWAVSLDGDADGDTFDAELSFGSTSSLASNDTRSRISTVGIGFAGAAAAPFIPAANSYSQLPDIPVGMGERIYLHSSATAAVVGRIQCNLHFDFNLDKAMVRRR